MTVIELVDQALPTLTERELVPAEEVLNLLLDIRLACEETVAPV
jgi:hypothetical protein